MTVTNVSSNGSAFGNWSDTDLFGGTENTPISQMEITPIRMRLQLFLSMDLVLKSHGLKSSQLGLVDIKIDGKSVGELDFYTAEQLKKVY